MLSLLAIAVVVAVSIRYDGTKPIDDKGVNDEEIISLNRLPDIPKQKSYSTDDGLSMSIVNINEMTQPVDSIVVKMTNNAEKEALFGEFYGIDRWQEGYWKEVPYSHDTVPDENGEVIQIIFPMVGYPVSPHAERTHTVSTKRQNKLLVAGRYRLYKTFSYPPYPNQREEDTAYVEFEIR